MELLAFDEGARREMPLKTEPLSEATTLAWALVSRETVLFSVANHVWA